MLRWIGTVIIPVPAALILSTFVRLFGMSIVEPDDDWPEVVAMFAFGALLAIIPGLIAPKFKTHVSCISASLYFITDVVLIACGRVGFLMSLPLFVGLVTGVIYFDTKLSEKLDGR